MKDVQGSPDHRRVDIRKVGVKTISYPLILRDRERDQQRTVARVNMYVNLPHHFKGTHMSRFVEILNRFHGSFTPREFVHVLEEMKERLDAGEAHLELEFPYFHAPRDGSPARRRCDCRMHGSLGRREDLALEVALPISPPMRARAGEGLPRSSGRWGRARVEVRFSRFLWIEELVDLVEQALARGMRDPEQASAEALGQELARTLGGCRAVSSYSVCVENLAADCTLFAVFEGP